MPCIIQTRCLWDSMSYHVCTTPYGSGLYWQAVRLREAVLRDGFGQPFSQQELAVEKDYIHIISEAADKVCATAMLVPYGQRLKMQRVATHPDHQRQGLGSSVMAFCENWACRNGYMEMLVHARESAISFYKKHQYIGEGDYFLEDTSVPHLKMRKVLA